MRRLTLLGNGLVVLVGMPCAGKSSWAAAQCDPPEVVSFDALLPVCGSRPGTWRVMHALVESRLAAGLRVVVDFTNLQADERAVWRQLARSTGMRAALVGFDITLATALDRNARRSLPLSDLALRTNWARWRQARARFDQEEWDMVHILYTPEDQ